MEINFMDVDKILMETTIIGKSPKELGEIIREFTHRDSGTIESEEDNKKIDMYIEILDRLDESLVPDKIELLQKLFEMKNK